MAEICWRALTAVEQTTVAHAAGASLSYEHYGFDLATHETPRSRHLAAMRAERRRMGDLSTLKHALTCEELDVYEHHCLRCGAAIVAKNPPVMLGVFGCAQCLLTSRLEQAR